MQGVTRAAKHKGRVLEVTTSGILCMRFASGRIVLVPRYLQDGQVLAYLDGWLNVARVVTETFHGPPPLNAIAHHADGDLVNNDRSNVRWAQRGEVHRKCRPVEMVRPDNGEVLLKFLSKTAAERHVDVVTEDRRRRGRLVSLTYAMRNDIRSRGFYWRYAAPDGA